MNDSDILNTLTSPKLLSLIDKSSRGPRNPDNDVVITMYGKNYPNKCKTLETFPNGNKLILLLKKD